MKHSLTLSLVCACVLSSACALTSRSDPLQFRYFSADLVRAENGPASVSKVPHVALRLERVSGSAHLGESIAYRSGAHELGYYELDRWTERPEAFLERGLSRALFQEQGVTRVMGGISETLSVELISFEEVRGPKPVARIEVGLVLHDERESQLEQTIRIERPIATQGGDQTARAVAALSEAMAAAVEQIARTVTERLHVLAAADAAPSSQPAEAASR